MTCLVVLIGLSACGKSRRGDEDEGTAGGPGESSGGTGARGAASSGGGSAGAATGGGASGGSRLLLTGPGADYSLRAAFLRFASLRLRFTLGFS